MFAKESNHQWIITGTIATVITTLIIALLGFAGEAMYKNSAYGKQMIQSHLVASKDNGQTNGNNHAKSITSVYHVKNIKKGR